MRTRSQHKSSRGKEEEVKDSSSCSMTSTSREAVVRCINQTKSRKQIGRKREGKSPVMIDSIEMEEKTLKGNGEQKTEAVLQEKDGNQKPEQVLLSCRKDGTSPVQKDRGGSVSCYPSSDGEDATESFWVEGTVSVSDFGEDYPSDIKHGLTVEFIESPSSSQRKSFRRASAEEKELAVLVHKVHLLCLLARGRLVDSACSDPLIQASLLSLLPPELLKIADVPKLTTNVLAPLVKWFHSSFQVQSPSVKEGSHTTNLAFALGSREGSAEEVVALSVALFRALNLPARFVSILGAAPLKPDTDVSGSSHQDGPRLDTRISSSSKTAGNPNHFSAACPTRSSSGKKVKKDVHQNRIGSLTCNENLSACSSVGKQLADEMTGPSPSKANRDKADTCTKMDAKEKRKGDLEFDLQLEMALSATAAGFSGNRSGPSLNDLNGSLDKTPLLKKMKTKAEGSPVSISANPGAVWSRRTGPPLNWAEVYCSGETMSGRWVHVDVANAIIDGEQNVEAASAACRKPLKYVVAFAGKGAKDVTRRYCTQWYKIAPHRVCSEWWDAVLAPLKELESNATGGTVHSETCLGNGSGRICNSQKQSDSVGMSSKEPEGSFLSQMSPQSVSLDGNPEIEKGRQPRMKMNVETSNANHSFASRNSLEDMELETRALTEPLPTNQQAYRNHHLYVIERWLTKYQILHPRGPVLGYCSGHAVYPRSCVQTLQTKQRWLRDGLQVKANEFPAKVIRYSSKFGNAQTFERGVPEEDISTDIELYGKWQMEPQCLPHAVNGIVPKNERGQVDVWSEKCLPPGTVHLRLPRLVPVARRLDVDFAPAMVGFEFHNGRSFPIFEGIVICTEFKDAILMAYAEEEERREAEEKKQSEAQALSRWYQLLSSMITRQRLSNSYEGALSSRALLSPTGHGMDMLKDIGKVDGQMHTEPLVASSIQDARTESASAVSHEHIFPLEDQTFDEESSLRTKRCPCGFSIEVEEL